jgi:hypothetical protein
MPEMISPDPEIQAAYEAMLADGVSDRLAEMLALQSPPSSRSDREFWRGKWNQFEKTPHVGDAYKKAAEAANVNVTGKRYLSGLARFPGDPEAWVSDRSDVQRVVQSRGWACEGIVNVKPVPLPEPPQEVGVAEHIIDRVVAEETAKNPALLEEDRQEVRHKVRKKIKPHWVKE